MSAAGLKFSEIKLADGHIFTSCVLFKDFMIKRTSATPLSLRLR